MSGGRLGHRNQLQGLPSRYYVQSGCWRGRVAARQKMEHKMEVGHQKEATLAAAAAAPAQGKGGLPACRHARDGGEGQKGFVQEKKFF